MESAERLRKLVTDVMLKSANILIKRPESDQMGRNQQVIAQLGSLAHAITNEYNVLCENMRGALLNCTNADVCFSSGYVIVLVLISQ